MMTRTMSNMSNNNETKNIIKTASYEASPPLPGMVNPANQTAAKVIYIVLVEDPSSKSGTASYVCLKNGLREGANRIEITGASISSAQKSKITTKTAETLLGKTTSNVIIPWSRVVSIKNLTYSK